MTTMDVSTCVGTIRVRVAGDGPVAVLWHSLFVDSRSWQHVEAELAQQRTLVLIDGPSHGHSQPAERQFTLTDCARAATEVLDQLETATPVDWVGNAWGGHVGMVLAAEHPERVRSLIAFASPVTTLSPVERRRIVPLVGLYRMLGPTGFIRNAVVEALLTAAVRQDHPEEADIVNDVIRHANRTGLYLAMRSVMLGRPDLTGLLPLIQAPTILVAGDDDPLWTQTTATTAAARLPQGQAATITGSRHLPALEAPEQVISLVSQQWTEPATIGDR